MTEVISLVQRREALTKTEKDVPPEKPLDGAMTPSQKAKAKAKVAAVLDTHPLRGSSW